MADINGTSGNDAIQPYGSSLLLTLSGSSGEGSWPLVNVLVNGVVVLSGVSITADYYLGQTQIVSAPIDGTPVTSVTLEYTNDTQTSWETGDRNVFVSSILLNGHVLPVTAAVYHRTGGTDVPGQSDMIWGGSLEFTGAVVANSTSLTGGPVSVDGMGGIDTVVLANARAEYSISLTSTGGLADEISGTEDVTLTGVERLDFQDIDVAIDMDGHAGTVAKLLSALFGQSYLGNEQYVGIGLRMLDGGTSESDAAALAIGTQVFTSLAGSTSNADFVELVFQNVMGTAPTQSQLNEYVGMLDSGVQTKASLAVIAAESSYNAVHLTGVMETGIEYT
jgi:hypothetical protein